MKLKEECFAIVWIDESSFSSVSLPLYSWILKGSNAERIIMSSSKRYNIIAAQWNKKLYFIIKIDSTNETSSLKFYFGDW